MSQSLSSTIARDRAALVNVSNALSQAMNIVSNAIRLANNVATQIQLQTEYNVLNNTSHQVTQAIMTVDDQLFVTMTTNLKNQAAALQNVQNGLNQITHTIGIVAQAIGFVAQALGFIAAL